MRKLTAMIFTGALLAPLALAAQDAPPARPDAAPLMRLRQHRADLMGMGPGQSVFAPQMLLNRRTPLALTDDQVKQLEALSTEVQQVHEKAQADGKPHQEKLAELWKADQPDAAALQAEMRALMQTHQTAALSATAAAARAKGLLTAEQRGRVEGWGDARRMMQGRRFGPGMGPGDAARPGGGVRMQPRMRRFQ
jgi:Spy/CpxP family protein refolding chaperone